MSTAIILCRLILASVFMVASLAKLTGLDGWRQTIGNFGIPAAFVTPLVFILPMAELLIAVLLIPAATAHWGGLGALLLLLAFILVISVNLAQGRQPDCNCFGQLQSSPIGPLTLIRNFILALCAGFVFWFEKDGSGPSILMWVRNWNMLFPAVVAIAIAAVTWLVIHLFRQQGRLLILIDNIELRINAYGVPPLSLVNSSSSGLLTNTTAPTFELRCLSGRLVTLNSLVEDHLRSLLLIFSDPKCVPCAALLPDIINWEKNESAHLTIAIISQGTLEENRIKFTEYDIQNILIQDDGEVSEAYRALATPSAVLVDPKGLIAAPLAIGAQAIADLVSRVSNQKL